MGQVSGNLICASLFTGVYDVNRNEMLPPDAYEVIKKWCQSIEGLALQGVVFHNSFSEKTISEAHLTHIHFIRVDFNTILNANVYRYLVYWDFLKKNGGQIRNVFFTDIADVEVIRSPFEDLFFIQNPDCLFCGDEESTLHNEWMHNHCTHLRNLIPDFKHFEAQNASESLLNCGVIGGKTAVMIPLMEELSRIHSTYTISNKTPYTLDMGAFNFVARTRFSDRLKHGFPVNTRFKHYETERTNCWFRHK